ncbi:MAG: response regulator [Rhodospirillales bacterium]|nr:response regulator [Rhodospirillales bacterium]
MDPRGTDARPFEVLLVEDNVTDAMITSEALGDCIKRNHVTLLDDGSKVMPYLRGKAPYKESIRPDLILLDLNMPGTRGHDVLCEIKNDKQLCSIPVCVLTASKAQSDVMRSYQLNANCYITKPLDFEKFSESMRLVCDYWFEVATLPPMVS